MGLLDVCMPSQIIARNNADLLIWNYQEETSVKFESQ